MKLRKFDIYLVRNILACTRRVNKQHMKSPIRRIALACAISAGRKLDIGFRSSNARQEYDVHRMCGAVREFNLYDGHLIVHPVWAV